MDGRQTAAPAAPVEVLDLRKYLECVAVLCKANAAHAGADDPANFTVFHSAVEPGISIADYILRVDKHVDAGAECVLLSLVLIGRYTRATGRHLSPLTAHRLLLTALRVVTKVQHDYFRSNRTFAKVGGLPIDELCKLEVHLLRSVAFAVQFTASDLACIRGEMTIAVSAELPVVPRASAAVLNVELTAARSFLVSPMQCGDSRATDGTRLPTEFLSSSVASVGDLAGSASAASVAIAVRVRPDGDDADTSSLGDTL